MDFDTESVDLAVLQQSQKAMEMKIDDLQQQLFESQRNNKTYKSLIQEMESEMEILQKSQSVTQPKNESKDDENKCLKNEIEELDHLLNEKSVMLSDTLNNLKLIKKEKDDLLISYNSLYSEHKECTKNVASLNTSNNDLNIKIELLKESLENMAASNITNTERIKYLENELKETQEILQSTNNTLKIMKETLQETQDEKALISNELTLLKSQSKNLERGNSLFSEVDDQRELVTHQFKSLKEKYIQLKRKLMRSESELINLRSEKLKLLEMKDEEKTKEYESLLKHFNNCEIRIKELERMNNVLSKRPENPKVVTIDDTCSNFGVVESLIEDARSESRKLREQLQTASSNRLFESEKLCRAEHEASALRRKVYEFETQIKILKQQLAVKDSVSIVEEPSTVFNPEDPKRKVHFADNVKENDGGKKLERNPVKQDFPKMFISLDSQPLKENNK